MRALSHSDTDHYIELERGERQFPSKTTELPGGRPFFFFFSFRCTRWDDTRGGSARSSRAKSMELCEISDTVKKNTDVTIMEEF